jgi:long-chain acyl-CoA synthetase
MYEKKPWLRFYGAIPPTLTYPDLTLYGAVHEQARKAPARTALIFMGRRTTYAALDREIGRACRGFAAQGMRRGDRVLVCLPNIPQAVIALYALSRLGAIPAMIHPLSAPAEIRAYARQAGCTWGIILDAFYPRFAEARGAAGAMGAQPTGARQGTEAQAVRPGGLLERILVCSVRDALGPVMKLGFALTEGRKIPALPADASLIPWTAMRDGSRGAPEPGKPDPLSPDETAILLFSGGTTGISKAIMLSSRNCNALAIQTNAAGGPVVAGDSMLSILPLFHGFGLAVGVHAMLINGATCILVPRFSADGLADLVRKYKPSFMAGVPTLFDALAANRRFASAPLGGFKGLFCGGDSLSRQIKERFDAVVRAGGGTASLREGYGLTETVTANMLMPRDEYREGSMGIPYPDMAAKVVRVDTAEEAPVGEDGEICVAGPTVMLGYLDDPEETASVLRVHGDGLRWVHTGDLGYMDADGFFYFKQRVKRIIKTSGISVYPSQIEDVLNKHPAVRLSCVIGVDHPTKVQIPKGFVTLKDGFTAGPALEKELIELCQKELLPHACPRCIEFKDRLPLTLVGKVAYRQLEEQEQGARPGTEA